MRYARFIYNKGSRIVIASFPDDYEDYEIDEILSCSLKSFHPGETASWEDITQEEAERKGIDLVY